MLDREFVLSVLATVLVLPLAMLGNKLAGQVSPSHCALRLERRRWRALWSPLLVPALLVAALVGTELFEPEEVPGASWFLMLLATPFFLIWTRAAIRAVRTILAKSDGPAFTSGFLRPRSVFAADFRGTLDPAALRAAEEHEGAHAAHFDPLRILLGQIAADLQWPWRGGARRLAAWREALELARDEEARAAGVDGADLAAAIVAAARFRGANAGAALHDEATLLEERIARLLAPPAPAEPEPSWSRAVRWVLVASFVGALAAGATWGEPILDAVLLTE